jgi:CheY-like chemotaxis protein
MGLWGARVLLVEHDEPALEVASRALRAKGADVMIAPDAGAALATVIGVVPDVLVVDLSRHVEDGIGFVQTVRSLSPEKGGQIPALTLGAVPLARSRLKSWRAALFQGHVLGPLDAVAFQEAVGCWAGRAVERRRRSLARPFWPRDVSRDRRAELRGEMPAAYSPDPWLLGAAGSQWYQRGFSSGSSTGRM